MCPTLVVLYFYYHTAGVIPLECSSTYSCWVPRLSGICVMLQLRWGLQRQTGYSCYVHLNAPIWMFPEPCHRTELSLLHLSLHLNGWTHGCQTAFRFFVYLRHVQWQWSYLRGESKQFFYFLGTLAFTDSLSVNWFLAVYKCVSLRVIWKIDVLVKDTITETWDLNLQPTDWQTVAQPSEWTNICVL